MKEKFLILVIIVSIWIPYIHVWANDRVGNGGDVVVCGDNIELLDIYEAKLNNIKLRSFKNSEHIKMLEELLKTLFKDINPKKSDVYLEFYKNMPQELRMIPNIHLNDVDDAGVVAIPAGCSLEQIVIQLAEDDIPSDGFRYTFNKDLWDKLDEYNKMALLLHELVYRDAIENKRVGGMVVRSIIGQLLNSNIDLLKYFTSYYKLSDNIEYKSLIWKNIAFGKNRLLDIKFDRNEFNEEVLFIQKNNNSIFQIRKSDGKLVSYKNNADNQWIPVLYRKNTLTYYKNFIGITPSEEMHLKPLDESDYEHRFIFEKPIESIKFTTMDGNVFLNITHVNKLEITSPSRGFYLSGSFDGNFSGVESNSGNWYFLNFNGNYELVSLLVENKHFAQYRPSFGGVFNCQLFEFRTKINELELKKCSQGEEPFLFKVPLKGKELTFTFYPNFQLDNDPYRIPLNGVFDLETVGDQEFNIPVKLTKEVYLGKTSGLFKKDVVLPIGNYFISTYKDTLLLHGNNKYYHLNKDGSVKVSTEDK